MHTWTSSEAQRDSNYKQLYQRHEFEPYSRFDPLCRTTAWASLPYYTKSLPKCGESYHLNAVHPWEDLRWHDLKKKKDEWLSQNSRMFTGLLCLQSPLVFLFSKHQREQLCHIHHDNRLGKKALVRNFGKRRHCFLLCLLKPTQGCLSKKQFNTLWIQAYPCFVKAGLDSRGIFERRQGARQSQAVITGFLASHTDPLSVYPQGSNLLNMGHSGTRRSF